MSDKVIKKGTTILTEEPFAFVLNSIYRTDRCDNCFKSGKMLKCSRCQYVHYCDRNCQKESWRIHGHKIECAHLKKISLEPLLDDARLMARIIIKLNKVGDDVPGLLLSPWSYYNNKHFRTFKDLMSHYLDIIVDMKRMERFTMTHKILVQLLDETLIPNISELIIIYGKMCTNRFGIVNEFLNDIGLGIYLGASIIDHSCKPNAIATFEGTTIIIRTLTDLPSMDWSQIRITYVNLLNSNKDRREELHNLYYFWCDCERCKEKEPMAEAAACPNSSCDWPCSIEADKCEKCNVRISVEFKKTFHEVVDFTARHLKKMETTALIDVSDLSKTCLEKQKGIMHKFNIQHIRTLERMFVTAMNLGCSRDAEFYGTKLLQGYLLYLGEVYPDIGILYLHLGITQQHLGKSKEALEALNKANTVLMITHGDKHSLVRKLRPMFYMEPHEVLFDACIII